MDHAQVVERIEDPARHRGELEWLTDRARYWDAGVEFSEL